jgi:large subunit ribosomal protein L35Ae
MEGRIIQFRRGRKTIIEKHFLIEIKGISNRAEAEKMIGKSVVWTSPAGKKIKGKISAPHGGKGLIRAIFETGLPGQAVTNKVSVLASETKTSKPEKKPETKRELEVN